MKETPTLILRDGIIITMDETNTVAEAIAIAGDRIVAVSSNAEIDRLGGPETEVVELEAKTVVPGLICFSFPRSWNHSNVGFGKAKVRNT